MHSHRHSRLHQALPDLLQRLRSKSRRLTGPREAILHVLREQHHPVSAGELLGLLPPGYCDLATVYRSLRLLEQMTMVKRFDLGDGIARFELLAEGDDGHHHHLVCTRCAQVVEIDGCWMGEVEQHLQNTNGFTSITHKLEFFGVCPACQDRPATESGST